MPTTRHEVIVGLHITDESSYTTYRAHMTPLLESMGAHFRYDMRIAEHLKGDADEPFTRLFIISFPDEPTKDRFFTDERYQKIRQAHFENAVSSHTIISTYDTTP